SGAGALSCLSSQSHSESGSWAVVAEAVLAERVAAGGGVPAAGGVLTVGGVLAAGWVLTVDWVPAAGGVLTAGEVPAAGGVPAAGAPRTANATAAPNVVSTRGGRLTSWVGPDAASLASLSSREAASTAM